MEKCIWMNVLIFGIILIFLSANCCYAIDVSIITQDYITNANVNEKIITHDTKNQNEIDDSIFTTDSVIDYHTLTTSASGNFWIDLKPGGGHDGGKFENEGALWTIQKRITLGDFDDTGYHTNWTTQPGIYSEIRTDEDLWDGTTAKGAWCTTAAEQGGIIFIEDSKGYANISTSSGFSVNQYADVSLPNFRITNATLYCDYKMYSWDFDNSNDYVYFNIIIKDLSNNGWDFFNFSKHSGNPDAPTNIGHGYPGNGWCTDFWDPGNGHVNPNDPVDNYQVDSLYGNETLATYLNEHAYTSNFSICFWLDIRLYGAQGNKELFKFWLDDFGIYCEYTYNHPPNTPTNPTPPNGQTNAGVSSNLRWMCYDPDGDDLTYDVYFGTSITPSLVSSNQSQTYYDPPGILNYNTQYFWKIVAKDGVNSTTGPTWSFITGSQPPSGDPPYIPSAPSPANGTNDIDINTLLSWTGGDPDGDDVVYDVYFEANDNTPDVLVSNDQGETIFNPGTLEYETTYYWQISANDGHWDDIYSPIWHFTTKQKNDPPEAPIINGPISGKTNIAYLWNFTTIDPENDEVFYKIDWGDGTMSDWYGPYSSSQIIQKPHIYSYQSKFTITAKAKDLYGLESDWGPPLQVNIKAIEITIKGGLGIKATIKNTGTTELTQIPWLITLNHKTILGNTKSGTIPSLLPGELIIVRNPIIFGFGKTSITVVAGEVEANASGTILLFFVVGVK